MRVVLDRADMLPEFAESVSCSQTRFEHFRDYAQMAIIANGSGMFIEYDGRSYNAIRVPTFTDSEIDTLVAVVVELTVETLQGNQR